MRHERISHLIFAWKFLPLSINSKKKKKNMEYASINRQYNNGEIKFSSQNQNSSGVLIKCEFKSTFSVV